MDTSRWDSFISPYYPNVASKSQSFNSYIVHSWQKLFFLYLFSLPLWKGWRPAGHEAVSRADGPAIWPSSGQGLGKGGLCQCLCRAEEHSGTTREGATVGACQLGPNLILPTSLNSYTRIWCIENIDLSASLWVCCLPVSVSSRSTCFTKQNKSAIWIVESEVCCSALVVKISVHKILHGSAVALTRNVSLLAERIYFLREKWLS